MARSTCSPHQNELGQPKRAQFLRQKIEQHPMLRILLYPLVGTSTFSRPVQRAADSTMFFLGHAFLILDRAQGC